MTDDPKPLTDKQLSAIKNDYGDEEPTRAPDSRIGRLIAEVRRLRADFSRRASELCWACRDGFPREAGRHLVPEDDGDGRVTRTCDAWSDVWSKLEP